MGVAKVAIIGKKLCATRVVEDEEGTFHQRWHWG